jgi:hypothetical protein
VPDVWGDPAGLRRHSAREINEVRSLSVRRSTMEVRWFIHVIVKGGEMVQPITVQGDEMVHPSSMEVK